MLVTVGYRIDELGRPVERYIDTDDMSQEDYANFINASNKIKEIEKVRSTKENRLKSNLLGVYSIDELVKAKILRKRILNKYC